MASANPAMNDAVWRRAGYAGTAGRVMTLEGSVLKTVFLMLVLVATAGINWPQVRSGTPLGMGLLIGGAIGGFITALITVFMPRFCAITAPIYAALEGLVLGGISAVFEQKYPGIVTQAVISSIGVLAMMLFLYGTRIIQATERFKIGVVAATGSICLVYFVGFVLSFFGISIPYIHQSGLIGIGFSIVVVVIAALNLILDFDFIERGVKFQAPKYMEWYGGFSLIVTLVWMYLEILRLLSKLRSRD